MTRRDEIIAGIPTAEDLDLIAVDQTGGPAMMTHDDLLRAGFVLPGDDPPQCPPAVRCEGPCPDIDRAIEERDNAPERFAAARCCKCGEPVGEKYHVSHGFVTCDSCRNKEAAEFSTYPPANRSNWDE